MENQWWEDSFDKETAGVRLVEDDFENRSMPACPCPEAFNSIFGDQSLVSNTVTVELEGIALNSKQTLVNVEASLVMLMM